VDILSFKLIYSYYLYIANLRYVRIPISFIEHLLIFLQVYLELFVSSVLSIDWGDIFDISDFSVVILLELVLIGLDFLTELTTLLLYISYYSLNLLL
jgi:hypothetical protein